MDQAGRMTWVDWLRDEPKGAGRAQLRGGYMRGPRDHEISWPMVLHELVVAGVKLKA